VRRLLAVGGIEYDAIWLLTTRADKAAARALASELGRQGPAVSVEALEVTDPSDHEQLFTAVLPVVRTLPP
jgi:hypothetical protein